jgi:predicted RNase H-like HicB family nuclease
MTTITFPHALSGTDGNRSDDVRFDCYENAFELSIAIVEEECGYTAIALRLPGVASCGDTIDEAVRNVVEAFIGAYEGYAESNDEIPWVATDIAISGYVVARKKVLVDV